MHALVTPAAPDLFEWQDGVCSPEEERRLADEWNALNAPLPVGEVTGAAFDELEALFSVGAP